MCDILCDIMLFRSNLHQSFDFIKDILILTKIHQIQLFIYLYGFKYLVLYNLVVCYSLDPVLVIWHITLIIFC